MKQSEKNCGADIESLKNTISEKQNKIEKLKKENKILQFNHDKLKQELNKGQNNCKNQTNGATFLGQGSHINGAGFTDNSGDKKHKFYEKLKEKNLPENIQKRITKKITRYEQMKQNSSETDVARDYIERLLSIPWTEKTNEINDLEYAREILNKKYFGIANVKERIIEYLAVKQMSKSVKGQIICLVGPPGVGKSSLAKSIATATGRKFAKWKVNRVNDVAEVKGHRKTYIGAMPGKIMDQIAKAGSKNPVFLLDEIDKIGIGSRSDVTSAMLEVLDPDHNNSFTDNYVEEDYDLSEVMFIATANYLEQIPEALKDSMEIIQISGYTEEEKFRIAKDHLVGKIFEEYNITPEQLQITDEAIREIIKNYVKENGVRNLNNILKSIARKFAVKHIEENLATLKVTPQLVQKCMAEKDIEDNEDSNKNSQIRTNVKVSSNPSLLINADKLQKKLTTRNTIYDDYLEIEKYIKISKPSAKIYINEEKENYSRNLKYGDNIINVQIIENKTIQKLRVMLQNIPN